MITASKFAIRHKRLSMAAIAVVAISIADIAWADAQDALNFSLGAAVDFEDNLFREPDSTPGTGNFHNSDQVYTTNAGIKIDKPYSLQRFQLDAGIVDNRYQRNTFLDYTAFNYRAAWLWQLTPNISGVLSADQQQVLNSFSEFRDFNNQLNTARSIQTNQSYVFKADALIGGAWHVLGGVSEQRSRNSVAFNAVGNYVQDGIELGVEYVAPSENSITLMHRESKGDYGRAADAVFQLDSGFDQSETEAILDWRLSGKSAINAHFGYVDRQYDHFSSRDYDGFTGRLAYTWMPADKLRIITSISRNLYSFQQDINSYYVADTFSIGPVWQVTAKTSLRLRYDYSKNDYFGAIVPTERRKDNMQLFLLAADWKPRPTITISGTLQREARNSNFNNVTSPGGDLNYDANAATISAQLLF